MKATGLIRRIDDLGRVVIPKDIRRTMGLIEGDPLELFIDDDSNIMLRKYEILEIMCRKFKRIPAVCGNATNSRCLLTSMSDVMGDSSVGYSRDLPLAKGILDLIRSKCTAHISTSTTLVASDERQAAQMTLPQAIIVPIVVDGEAVGSLISNKQSSQEYLEYTAKLIACMIGVDM